jgi:hypothetical protein
VIKTKAKTTATVFVLWCRKGNGPWQLQDASWRRNQLADGSWLKEHGYKMLITREVVIAPKVKP